METKFTSYNSAMLRGLKPHAGVPARQHGANVVVNAASTMLYGGRKKGTPMRDLPDVIDAVVALLPTGHDLRDTLLDIKSSAIYSPPEGQQLWWREFSFALDGYLSYPPQLQWEKDVYRIVVQKEPPAEESSETAQPTTAAAQNTADTVE